MCSTPRKTGSRWLLLFSTVCHFSCKNTAWVLRTILMPFLIGQFTAVVQASFAFFFHGFNSFVLLFIRQWTFFSVIRDRSTIILLQILTAGFVKRPGRVFLLLASHLIAFLSVAGHLSKLSAPFVSERVHWTPSNFTTLWHSVSPDRGSFSHFLYSRDFFLLMYQCMKNWIYTNLLGANMVQKSKKK